MWIIFGIVQNLATSVNTMLVQTRHTYNMFQPFFFNVVFQRMLNRFEYAAVSLLNPQYKQIVH